MLDYHSLAPTRTKYSSVPMYTPPQSTVKTAASYGAPQIGGQDWFFGASVPITQRYMAQRAGVGAINPYATYQAPKPVTQPATPTPLPTVPTGGTTRTGGFSAQQFSMPQAPTTGVPSAEPAVPMMSLDEMMEIINRRVGLMIDPQVEGLERGREEERLGVQRQEGAVRAGFQEAHETARRMGQEGQRAGASTMRKRGIYDSGMAQDLSRRIQSQTAEAGIKLDTEQARALGDLAEYLNLRERHTEEQIQGLMGQRGEWAQSLLDEMHQQQQSRQDMLEQRAFENWLSQTAMEHQIWQANQAQRAAAARSRTTSPSGPSYQDIIQQLQLQALMSMPQEEQFQYALDPTLWRYGQEGQYHTRPPAPQSQLGAGTQQLPATMEDYLRAGF